MQDVSDAIAKHKITLHKTVQVPGRGEISTCKIMSPPPTHPLCTMHHAPCTSHLTPCTLHPAPCTLHLTPCTLHPAPCTLHPAPCTSHLTPHTLHPAPCTPHPHRSCILHPPPSILHTNGTSLTLSPSPSLSSSLSLSSLNTHLATLTGSTRTCSRRKASSLTCTFSACARQRSPASACFARLRSRPVTTRPTPPAGSPGPTRGFEDSCREASDGKWGGGDTSSVHLRWELEFPESF